MNQEKKRMYKFYHFVTGLFWTLLDFRFQLIFTVWLRAKTKQNNFSGTIEINLHFVFVRYYSEHTHFTYNQIEYSSLLRDFSD